MKKIVLLALLAFLAWWYFIGGRTLSEESVLAYYQHQQHATLSRDPAGLCSLIAEEYVGIGTAAASAGGPGLSMNKRQACDNYVALYDGFAALGEKMDGILMLDYSYDIHSIRISSDRKSAEVDVSYAMDVGGAIMHLRSRSKETLVRRNGKMLLARSEGSATMRAME